MLVVFLSNDSELVQWGDAPQVDDPFPGGGTVQQVELYQGEQETVCLALLEPINRESDETFSVQLAPDNSIIRYEWSMVGKPTTGRLVDYEPTGQGTLMRAVPTRWYVDQIKTCKPVGNGSYKAIYLCFCVDAPMSAAA